MSITIPIEKRGLKTDKRKPKVAIVLGANCSGCDYTILDIEGVFDILTEIDPVFWPTAVDFKLSDIEEMKDGEIDLSIWEGAINNDESEHLAKMVRKKSKLLLAFGACSCSGGIPAMANMSSKNSVLTAAYNDALSNEKKGEAHFPKPLYDLGSYKLSLPEGLNTVLSLDQVVNVDYYLPGCPPPLKLTNQFFQELLSGKLPPKGASYGTKKSVCEECKLKREHKVIAEVKRFDQIVPDLNRCLLDQGIICMGPATRGGCDAPCPSVATPCRGCMGPTIKVKDQGAKMLSALASILGLEGEENKSDKELDILIDQIKDPLGTFYRYTMSTSYLKKSVSKGE